MVPFFCIFSFTIFAREYHGRRLQTTLGRSNLGPTQSIETTSIAQYLNGSSTSDVHVLPNAAKTNSALRMLGVLLWAFGPRYALARPSSRKSSVIAGATIRKHETSRRVSRVTVAPRCVDETAISLLAGMFGGSVGMGVAYPLDTLAIKMQSRGRASQNALDLVGSILRGQGVGGFYSGVRTAMAGQAVIKGVVFSDYTFNTNVLAETPLASSAVALILASCLSGAVGSFVVTPVERIKCVMQTEDAGQYSSPLACAQSLIRNNGLCDLLFRGLGATMARETPSYGLYFLSYELVTQALISQAILESSLVPLIAGAIAGVMSWLPVYPIDLIKTKIQVSSGGDAGTNSFLDTTKALWKAGGFGAFWDGLEPKLARAFVNAAVTFYVYSQICSLTN